LGFAPRSEVREPVGPPTPVGACRAQRMLLLVLESITMISKKRVFFTIPLAGKRDEAGWDVTSLMLKNTLRSILRQTDPDFLVVITGHERPSIKEIDDPRVIFLHSEFAKPDNPSEYMRDKSRKKNNNFLYVSNQGGGYVILFDADDLASRHLVRYIREQNDPNGYIFKHGYALDYSTGMIAPIPGVWKDPFNHICGSCAAFYVTQEEIGSTHKEIHCSYLGNFKRHGKWEETAIRLGRPLRPVPFPAAVYVLNTSQNTSVISTVDKDRQLDVSRRISRHRVPITRLMIDDFSLAKVLPAKAETKKLLLRKVIKRWVKLACGPHGPRR
jgi:hypothetical protein